MKTREADRVLRLLEESGALKEGHFLLSSGLHSAGYVQCALLLQEPARARRVGELLAAELADFNPESILAPALGGLIIGHEVASALRLPFRFTERKDGVMTLRRGFVLKPGERIVIVEDVVTTGRSTRETMDVVRGQGGKVVGVGSILNRSGQDGGSFGDVPYRALAALDVPTYEPEACPLCQAGGTPEKPGSRFGLSPR